MASSSAPRRTPRPRKRGPYAKSSETRERILAAAFAVAGEVGIHRASIARIAERADVAVGNLHYHFGSRDELLREVVAWVRDELVAGLRDATAEDGDFLAKEEASMRAYLGFVHENPAYVRLAEEARLHQPELYREGMAMWLALFREAIEEAIARGELRAMEPSEVAAQAHFLVGARYFLDQMIAGVDYPGDDAVVAAYLNLVRSGLSKETP